MAGVSKILMFGWEFPPFNSGGLGTACFGLTKALSRLGVKVTFVLPKKVDVRSDFLRVIFTDIKSADVLNAYANEINYGGGLFEEVRAYAVKGGEIAGKEKFDAIHAHDWLAFGAGLEAKRVSGKPLVVHIHATEFDRTGGNGVNPLVYSLEKEGMEKADKIVAVSEYTKKILVKHYGIKPYKIQVVHNAIEPLDFKQLEPAFLELKRAGNKIVIFVGRITLQKGPDYFIRAAKRVLEINNKVIFIIAGSGDMERQIIKETAYFGISNRVLFTGFLRGDDLNKLYQSADLYVLPSVSEPFGLTPLEAALNGAPLLLSKQSGVSEVVSHALKVDFWDVEEMANKILAVLRYPALSLCLKENGGKQIKRLSWVGPAKECLKIYNQLATTA